MDVKELPSDRFTPKAASYQFGSTFSSFLVHLLSLFHISLSLSLSLTLSLSLSLSLSLCDFAVSFLLYLCLPNPLGALYANRCSAIFVICTCNRKRNVNSHHIQITSYTTAALGIGEEKTSVCRKRTCKRKLF